MPRPLAQSNLAPQHSTLLKFPLRIRDRIYTELLQYSGKQPLQSFPVAFTCRQIQSEFAFVYEQDVNLRLRCCLGRTMQDRNATKFYHWNYRTTPWSSSIEVTSASVEKLRTCFVRCTIEELGNWERRSEPGSECFKECLRILVCTFRGCQPLRELRVSFDHFILFRKTGMLDEADDVWNRLRDLCAIPALKEIEFEMPGLREDFVWRKKRSGKKEKGGEEWARVGREDACLHIEAGAKARKGYGLRRLNT